MMNGDDSGSTSPQSGAGCYINHLLTYMWGWCCHCAVVCAFVQVTSLTNSESLGSISMTLM